MPSFPDRTGPVTLGICALASFSLCRPVLAQTVDARFRAEPIASVTVVLAPGADDDADDARAQASALYEVELGGRAEYVLDNGAEIGGRLVWRGQRDHPNRPGGSGSPVAGTGTLPGAFSGLSSAERAGETGPRGALESAFVYLRGGYGEVSLGRDSGVAARFQVGNVDVFSMARAADSRLDPTGLGIVMTRADLTGPAEKLSYTSPRLLGVRAGISYAPEVERAGLDRNLVFGSDGLDRPELQDALELGLNVSRRLRASGTRVRAALGYARADLSPEGPGLTPSVVSDAVDVVSAGAAISREGFTLGGSVLESNDGLEAGDYSAWTVGASYAWQDWSASLSLGESDADSVDLSGDSLSFGLSRNVHENGVFTFGYQEIESRVSSRFAGNKVNRGGIVIELSLSL